MVAMIRTFPPFNPADWYYIVGGNGPHKEFAHSPWEADASRAWSTKRNAYVPYDDKDYATWRQTFGDMPPGVEPATRIDTEANLKDVLDKAGVPCSLGVDKEVSS
jgi:hypothetical protein